MFKEIRNKIANILPQQGPGTHYLPSAYLNAYNNLAQSCKSQFAWKDVASVVGNKNHNPKSKDEVAKVFVDISPSHAAKLLAFSASCVNLGMDSKERTLLRAMLWHYSNIIDLGSGVGTIPHALFALIEEVKSELRTLQLPIYPHTVSLVRVDRDLEPLVFGDKIVGQYKSKQIRINDSRPVAVLPNVDVRVFSTSANLNFPTVICASNLAHWMGKEEIETLLKRVSQVFTHPTPIRGYLRINAPLSAEKRGLWKVIEDSTFLSSFLPSPKALKVIHPKNGKPIPINWEYVTETEFDRSIFGSSVSSVPYDELKLIYEKAKYYQLLYFEGSELLWRPVQGASPSTIKYLETTLEFAWQSWISGQKVDWCYKYKIKKKKPGDLRDLVLLSPIDAIIEMKIISELGPKIEAIMDNFSTGNKTVSLGNRLNVKSGKITESRSIFKYWPNQFKRRLFLTLQLTNQNPNGALVCLDIENFYPTIPKSALMDVIDKYFPNLGRNTRAWVEIYIKDCPTGKGCSKDQGIPQGPPLSHILANLYLYDKLDSNVLSAGFNLSQYIRYVDDIRYVADSLDEANRFLKWIETALAPLHINHGKTAIIENKKYQTAYQSNIKIDSLKNSHDKLMQNVYLSAKVWSKAGALSSDDDYICFASALKLIGINIPWPWIKAKVGNTRYWKGLASFNPKLLSTYLRGVHLLVNGGAGLLTPKDLADKIVAANPSFPGTIQAVRTQIETLIRENTLTLAEVPENEQYLKDITQSRLRFLLYRLRYLVTPTHPAAEDINPKNETLTAFARDILEEISWSGHEDSPKITSDMDSDLVGRILRFCKTNGVDVTLPETLQLDPSAKLLALSLNNDKIGLRYSSNEGDEIIIENGLKASFPFGSSMSSTLDAHGDLISIWCQAPYGDTLKLSDDLPNFPNELYEFSSSLLSRF